MGLAPLVPAAAYARTIRASVERIFENALDWKHLPWLHGDSFSRVDLIEASSGGWRARVRGQPAEASEDAEIELVLDPSGPRYVTRTLSGRGAGSDFRGASCRAGIDSYHPAAERNRWWQDHWGRGT